MLFDTDVIIWFFRGNTKAERLLAGERGREISQVSWMELVQGVRDGKELNRLRAFLTRTNFRMLPLNENIGHRAALFMEQHALKDGLELADALIAATAVEYALPLATGNAKHYRSLAGVKLQRFTP